MLGFRLVEVICKAQTLYLTMNSAVQKNPNSFLKREMRCGANTRFDGVCTGQSARIPAAICRLILLAVLVTVYLT